MSIRSMMIGGAGASPPDAPTGVSATSGSDASSTVSFSAPANNGGSAITGYRVTASPGGATFTGSSSPITATGLTNGTTYTFTVAAQNAIGFGSESSGATGTPTAVVINLTVVNDAYGPFGPTSFGAMTVTGDGQAILNPRTQDGSGSTSGGQGIFLLTLPAGTYNLSARGAAGELNTTRSGGTPTYGQPAVAAGTFTFPSAQDILILVGQRPRNNAGQPDVKDGGGGGGTFITKAPNSSGTAYSAVQESDILLVGGGASMGADYNGSEINAATGTSGKTGVGGTVTATGGSNGYGGRVGCGTGGAGWRGNGNQATASTAFPGPACVGEGFGSNNPNGNSQAFIFGGKGGRYSDGVPDGPGGGGFGGGGSQGNNGIGGGGGYSGGGSTYAGSSAGGGGGSYAASGSVSLWPGTQVGGRVIITKV
jgi:hypothetical protein